MESFEAACAVAATQGERLDAAAKALAKAAKALTKAAAEGNATGLGNALADATEAVEAIGDAGADVSDAWPYSDDEVVEYLEGPYREELIAAARGLGVTISPVEDRLAAFPLLVTLQPAQRAVRLNATRVTSLRPSTLARIIAAHQKKAPTKPEQFIETLYRASQRVAEAHTPAYLLDIYDVLTLMPETRRAYGKAEFARDVFVLQRSTVRTTRSGAEVSFPGATVVKGGKKVLTVVDERGRPQYLSLVRFEKR